MDIPEQVATRPALDVIVSYWDPDRDDTHELVMTSTDEDALAIEQDVLGATNVRRLVPGAGFVGSVRVNVVVTDDGEPRLSDSQSFVVTVENTNDAPIIEPIADITTREEQTANVAVIFTDPDPEDSHTINFVYDDTQVSVVGEGNTSAVFALMPAVDFVGQTDITGGSREQLNGLSAQTTFRLSVSNTGDAPIIEAIGDRATGIAAIDIPIRFTDADPTDEHVLSVTSSDARVLITGDGQVSGSIYTLTPVDDFEGRVRITVGVTDNSNDALSDTESFWLNVSNDFVAPVLSPLADVEIDEDESAALTIVFSDQNEGDDHEISVSVDGIATSVSGTGDESPATRRLEPDANANGNALVTVRVTDNRGLFDEAQFEFRVNPVNDAPSIEALERATREDTVLTANIPSNDIDGDALVFRTVVQPDHGQVTWSDENPGEFTYAQRELCGSGLILSRRQRWCR